MTNGEEGTYWSDDWYDPKNLSMILFPSGEIRNVQTACLRNTRPELIDLTDDDNDVVQGLPITTATAAAAAAATASSSSSSSSSSSAASSSSSSASAQGERVVSDDEIHDAVKEYCAKFLKKEDDDAYAPLPPLAPLAPLAPLGKRDKDVWAESRRLSEKYTGFSFLLGKDGLQIKDLGGGSCRSDSVKIEFFEHSVVSIRTNPSGQVVINVTDRKVGAAWKDQKTQAFAISDPAKSSHYKKPKQIFIDVLNLIRTREHQAATASTHKSCFEGAKDYRRDRAAGKVPEPFNGQTHPKTHERFLQWKNDLLPILTEGHAQMRGDPEAQKAWYDAMMEGTRLLYADPDRRAAWYEAMRAGLAAYHADPARHAAWCRKISDAHIRLWKDTMFVLNRPAASFYKNRFVPGLIEVVVLLTAGWEYRTILLLLHLGIPYAAMAHDDRTPPVLAGSVVSRDTATFKYAHNGTTKTYFPDHAVDYIQQSIAFLKAMGIPDGVVSSYRDADGAASFFSLETKCKGGMLHLGNFDKDLAKWQACAALHLMTFAAWTPEGLVFGYVNKEGEGDSILVVTKMLIWSASNCNAGNEAADYLAACTLKATKYLSSHMTPLVAVQSKLGPQRRIFNGAVPALGQTKAEHLPWEDTVAYINVGREGRGVVNSSNERRIGRVVGDDKGVHKQLDKLLLSAELDLSVLKKLQDVPNSSHFIEAKLKPVDRAEVKAMVKAAEDKLKGKADGQTKLALQKTLEESLKTMRAHFPADAMEAEYAELEGDDDEGEEYDLAVVQESGGKRKRGPEGSEGEESQDS